jgi:hypothetical protein
MSRVNVHEPGIRGAMLFGSRVLSSIGGVAWPAADPVGGVMKR